MSISTSTDRKFLKLKHDQAALRCLLDAARISYLASKFDQNQPRIPAGSPDGGQWGDGGQGNRPAFPLLPPYLDHARQAAIYSLEAALDYYNKWSPQNSAEATAIVSFQARQFTLGAGEQLDLINTTRLDRAETAVVCPRLAEVQSRTDLAAQLIEKNYPGLTPQDFGNAVHYNVSKQIRGLNDPNFRAEVSSIKSLEVNYGRPRSIRIDVLEQTNRGFYCAYDIKTGKAGLSLARASEIANNTYAIWGRIQPIVVVEIRQNK